MSDYLWPHGLYSPWNSLGQNTGVGSLSLLQGIFPTQGLNADLLHCRQILYQLSPKRSPRILEWVAFPFSRGSSQPRDWTQVSHIVGRCFTVWATREAHRVYSIYVLVDIAKLQVLCSPLKSQYLRSKIWWKGSLLYSEKTGDLRERGTYVPKSTLKILLSHDSSQRDKKGISQLIVEAKD